MCSSLSIITQRNGAMVRLVVTGEIDMSNRDRLGAVIASVIRDRWTAEIIVDLGDLTFLDASGVRTLLEGYRWARRHDTRLRVDHPRGLVSKVLQITNTFCLLAGCRGDERRVAEPGASGATRPSGALSDASTGRGTSDGPWPPDPGGPRDPGVPTGAHRQQP
jgi:anti-anti-sigma factor